MAKTVVVESKPAITKVGTSGNPLEYYVQTTYQVDDNGKLIQNTTKSIINYNKSTFIGIKNYIKAAESSDGGSNWKLENKPDGTPVFGADAQKSLKAGALKADTQKAIISSAKNSPQPLSSDDQKKLASSTKNQASDPGNSSVDGKPVNDADKEAFEKDNKSLKPGTRKEYGNVQYPKDLALEHQDCIKFSIIEYKPSLAKGQDTQGGSPRLVTVDSAGNPTIGKKTLGTITLPIPAGINDSNTVSWQQDPINELQTQFGNIAQQTISGGAAAGAGAAENTAKSFGEYAKTGEGQQGITGLIAGMAVGSNTIQQRAYGSTFNNNLELLFNGPSLRTFSFNFKLSPRNAPEARDIMKIIRFFKQAMSVKRSQSSLLLKTPHTFAISYLTSNKQHPYLNKFKECALTSFNVDYTPEGQYMTYMSSNVNERSMISYNISLTFEELEPIFDDEYGDESSQNILNVGY